MLTDKDFNKLLEIFATKKEVREIVHEELTLKLEPFKKEMLTGFDRIISVIETQNLENAARDAQLTRHDGWIQTIAKKTATELKD